jgi:hypothetical protein
MFSAEDREELEALTGRHLPTRLHGWNVAEEQDRSATDMYAGDGTIATGYGHHRLKEGRPKTS